MSGAGAWARDPDSIVVLTPHEEENCFTVTSILRTMELRRSAISRRGKQKVFLLDEETVPLLSLNRIFGMPFLHAASEFVPRSLLTRMLYDNFQARAEQRGTHINWIGVGTWDTPAQIIPKNHREAWKISRENFRRGNSAELQRIIALQIRFVRAHAVLLSAARMLRYGRN